MYGPIRIKAFRVSRIDKSEKFETVLHEIKNKLNNLNLVGLSYLNLNRVSNTLSGGESQRIKMVKHLGNSLVDLLYIFDEPSIGLHPKDLDNIIKIIQKLEIREIVFYWLSMILILLGQLIMSLIWGLFLVSTAVKLFTKELLKN